MSKTIHIELTEEEARAHFVAFGIASAMLAGREVAATLITAALWAEGEEFAQNLSSATRKIATAINPEAAAQADYMAANRQAAEQRRN
jgi:hypothetical protein